VSLTVQERWRLRRNLVIAVAAREGLPQSWIADALDLSEQRVSQICATVVPGNLSRYLTAHGRRQAVSVDSPARKRDRSDGQDR
jgi:hypothetical protein